jgi:hypothetical protein
MAARLWSGRVYGCETWSLTLRDEHRLRLFENRVLRSIFGPKREEVAGGWRRLHNENIHDLYAAPNIVSVIESRRINKMGGACSTHGKDEIKSHDSL